MRKSILVLILVFGSFMGTSGQISGKSAPDRAHLRFDDRAGNVCNARIEDRVHTMNREPYERFSIQCGVNALFSQNINDDLVNMWVSYPIADRIFTIWQGGSHVRVVIFLVTEKGIVSPVFDKVSEYAPDIVRDPDALIMHYGKQKTLDHGEVSPELSERYDWSGTSYRLIQKQEWNSPQHYRDHFCMLLQNGC